MRTWIRRRAIDPLRAQLRQGLSPAGLAWSLAVGLGLGIFPVLGTTTLLCVAAGFIFRLNQPALQVANYLAYPLQIILILPLVRIGERLLGAQPSTLSLGDLLTSARAEPLHTLAAFGTSLGHACLAWILVIPPLMVVAALALTLLLRLLSKLHRPSTGG